MNQVNKEHLDLKVPLVQLVQEEKQDLLVLGAIQDFVVIQVQQVPKDLMDNEEKLGL